MPWRDAYHDVRDHLERLGDENADDAVRAKKHEGTTLGIDRKVYAERFAEIAKSVKARQSALAKCRKTLLGV